MQITSLDKVLQGQMRAKGWKWTRLGSNLFVAPNDTADTTVLDTVKTFYPKVTLNESQTPGVLILKIGRAK